MGGDFGEGTEHEIALQHTGMRDLQIGSVDGLVGVEQDVQVDEARTLGKGFLAAHGRFDAPKRGEKLRGRKMGLGEKDGVEEPGLVEVLDGFGFVEARKLCDLNGGLRHAADGFAEMGLAVADIGTECKVDRGHVRLLYACAAPQEAEQGAGLGNLEHQGEGEEHDTVKAEDHNGEDDVAKRAEHEKQATGGGRCQ